MTAAFCIALALLVLFLAGCGIYGEHSARKQPEYEFGNRPEEGWRG
jgi:hypothetical protein